MCRCRLLLTREGDGIFDHVGTVGFSSSFVISPAEGLGQQEHEGETLLEKLAEWNKTLQPRRRQRV